MLYVRFFLCALEGLLGLYEPHGRSIGAVCVPSLLYCYVMSVWVLSWQSMCRTVCVILAHVCAVWVRPRLYTLLCVVHVWYWLYICDVLCCLDYILFVPYARFLGVCNVL